MSMLRPNEPMVPKTAPPGWGSTYIALIPATLELPKLKRFNFKALNPKTPKSHRNPIKRPQKRNCATPKPHSALQSPY